VSPSGPGTREVRIGCEFVHSSAYDVPAVFQVEPAPDQDVTVHDESWTSVPDQTTRTYRDLYGNVCRRLTIPSGQSTLTYSAVVTVPDAAEPVDETAEELAPEDLPDDVLIFTLPSRYCLPDVLGAEAWNRFGQLPKGYTRVQAICDYVNGHLTFQYGSSTARSTAADVHAAGYGVCRDFTLCRALNIPARYVFGYLPEVDVPVAAAPMDFAAWMEVYLGGRWFTFDPRNNTHRKGRVLIGRGRDAGDVAMATTYGAPWLQRMTVVAEENGRPRPLTFS
jgi:transglutaminase-like putative cysteine protease